jgi:hypothetical protein
MSQKNIPILHIDGSLSEYIDKRGILHKIAGLGGYLVVNGKIVDQFFKQMKDDPYLNHHEEYAIIEGLRWVREKGYKTVKTKSDSLHGVTLFNHNKKTVTKTDKFFLLQYMTIELEFDYIELVHHRRSDDDLSHNLSRSYLKELPKDVLRLHCENNKKKYDYEIIADATQKCEHEIKKILQNNVRALLLSTK